MQIRSNFKKEEKQYKFDFCKGCELYDECELVGEYARFSDNSPKIHESQTRVVVITNDSDAEQAAEFETAETDARKDLLSYTKCPEKFKKDGCIMSRRHVSPIACGNRRVTDGIGDHYKIEIIKTGLDHFDIEEEDTERWRPSQPVFISAQTGQGKNYFIENTLIPYVRELNHKNTTDQKILILSNRLALHKQIENRLKGTGDTEDKEVELYSYGEFADVMTYQSLLHRKKYIEKKQKKSKERYIYVICDEAHFFTSDASFNPYTEKILSAVVRLFQNAVRIYMSATPYDCLEYIVNCEEETRCRLNQGKSQDKWHGAKMAFYHFKRDYSYLDIKTYSAFSELYKRIIESVNEKKERWLIFIDDKNRCEKVKEDLERYGEELGSPLAFGEGDSRVEKVLAVNANSKNDSAYMAIVKKEQLVGDTYILISTSVLDNGINLNNIDNIVVSDMAKVKCIQMVGRARKCGENDRKTLYIRRFDSSYVETRIGEFQRQQDAYYDYHRACGGSNDRQLSEPSGFKGYEFLNKYYNGHPYDWLNAKHWFGRLMDEANQWQNPNLLYANEIAESMVDRYIFQYNAILDEMKSEDLLTDTAEESARHPGQKYLEHQLSWFGKVYCEDDDITFADKEKAKKAFVAFLEPYAANSLQIEKDKQAEFRAKFTELQDAAFGRKDRNKNRDYSITKMNSILEEESISYKVVSNSSYWIVQEHDWETEEE